MKFSGFGLSRVEGENLEELFEQFADAGEHWGSETGEEDSDVDMPKKFKTLGENLKAKGSEHHCLLSKERHLFLDIKIVREITLEVLHMSDWPCTPD